MTRVEPAAGTDIQAGLGDAGEPDVLVIGAGPAGLAAARALRARQVAYDHVERASDVGGLWDIDAAGTPMYESAHFISSRTKSAFPSFPMPADYPDYPSHRQVLDYLRSFADAYRLRPHIRFETAVERISPLSDERWRVTFADGSEGVYRHVVCATGMQWDPLIPDLPGSFSGEVLHSRDYRSAHAFAGKRVLVVGAGNSGCDIACDAGRVADQVFLSVRRGYWFIPKHIFGIPSDVFADSGPKLPTWLEQRIFGGMLRVLNGDVRRIGLPRPDHRLFETHPILNTEVLERMRHGDVRAKGDVLELDGDAVVFADGSREIVDVIIMATGYRHSIPYAQEFFGDPQHPDDLYLSVFSRRYPGLVALGFIETNSAAFGLFDQAARLIAASIAEQDPMRRRQFADLRMQDRPNLSGGIRFVRSPRHVGYVDSHALARAYRRLAHAMHWTMPDEVAS